MIPFTSINTPTAFRSAISSGGAPPLPKNKGNLLADKGVLPSADQEERDTTVVAEEAPGPLTPQASKGNGKRKRPPTAVVSRAMPDWASPGLRGDSKHRRLARDILREPSNTFPAGSGCSDCVARSRLCVVREDRTKCASCTAQGARSCDWASVGVGAPTANQMTTRPRVLQARTTQAAPAARVRPPVTTNAVRRPSSWTSPNEDLAEMLEDVEAGANPGALLRAMVGAIIELREAARHTTVPPTDYPDEGDSEAEEEGEEEGEKAAVVEAEEDEVVAAVVEGEEETAMMERGEEAAVMEREENEVVMAGLVIVKAFLDSWHMDLAE